MISSKPLWVVSLCLSLIFFSILPAAAENLRILSGLDLNGWLVRQGWARVNRLGSVTRYVQEETRAKAEQAGAWSSVEKYRWCCKGLDSERKNGLQFPSGSD